MSHTFFGAITALITPFSQNGEIDEAALRRLIDWQIEQGIHGLVPVGTTGESPTLDEDEHKSVIQITVEQVKGRVPVIAGAGSNSTAEAVEYTEFAEEVGADAVLHVAGYYNKPNQEGLYQHFKAIHDATALPIVLYNIPGRAIVNLEVETVARLAALERIVGIKDATSDLSRPIDENLAVTKPFSFLSGDDLTVVAYNVSGGNGCISVASNVVPDKMAQLQNLCREGDFESARQLQSQLFSLHQILFKEPSPAGVKYAMSLLGYCDEHCRLPMVPLQATTKKEIQQIMQNLGLI